MNRHPNVRQTLDLLARLRDALSELTTASRRLAEDAGRHRAAAVRSFDVQKARDTTDQAQSLETAAAAHQAARAALETRIQQRQQRLKQAHRSARRALLDRIEREESRQKFVVQKGTLDTDREEAALLEAAEARFQDFSRRQEEHHASLKALTRRARSVFRGFPGFRRALGRTPDLPESAAARSPDPLLEAAGTEGERAAAALDRFGRNPLAMFFRGLPPWILIALAAAAGASLVWLLPMTGRPGWTPWEVVRVLGPAGVALAAANLLAKVLGRESATASTAALTRAMALHTSAGTRAVEEHRLERDRAVASARQRRAELGALWDRSVLEAARRREEEPGRCEEKFRRIADRLERIAATRRQRLSEEQAAERESIRTTAAVRETSLREERERELSRGDSEFQGKREALASEWRQRIGSLYAEADAVRGAVSREFPAWEPARWEHWTPPATFADGVPFGSLEVDVAQLCGGLPDDPALALPGPGHFSLPLVLSYPEAGSLLLETGSSGSAEALDTLNQILLRLLASMPPGKLSITLVDPVRLGQSFAGVMHLADFEESLVNHRTWTQSGEIEERLADLNAHMEKVIQMYLRNEYATIADFNAHAGTTAEKYHVLVLADFPAACSDLALKRLVNIAASGARCGVFTLIHRDTRQPLPESILEPLRQSSVVLSHTGSGFGVSGARLPGVRLVLTPPPGPELMTGFLRQVGTAGRDTGRVRVPFSSVMPGPGQEWSLDTTEELKAPIGRTGATKLQYLALGRGTRQHALVAGKTGSGKSTLFHVLIHSLATWCGPDRVEFYLVDFKKGVEFSCYAAGRLPHARVVAIESDREFGLSVLQKVDDELRRRGDLFRRLGVQDLAGHHRATGGQPLPRALLLIDEFQEFFVEDDRVSQTASVLLDRIVRQGRAFGIHVVLGSQTLGGAYTLARTTLGQMVVRIALQCNEADALLIMDDSNPAPRLLTRPGEGIYNDRAGMVEGNSPFQTVWLDDQERDQLLGDLRRRADAGGFRDRAPFVFEGNAPALVQTNAELQAVIAKPPVRPPVTARVWLGAPNSIKGPTTAELHRQSDHHLLIVGQRDDAELALLGVGMLGLAAQFPDGAARFAILESTVPGSPRQQHLRPFLDAMPPSTVVGRAGELAAILGGLHKELLRRREENATEAPSTFLFIQGLQQFRALAVEDEFSLSGQDAESPAGQFRDLLAQGPAVGIHLIVTCDTWQNLVRCLGRKALNHFGLRVLFQMSADD
ncbi:MAG: ATP-binding protein, partial [Verrucomicrobia bacterium]|nr:ATP-binding protein [Verrucomicrobiota bacterium]